MSPLFSRTPTLPEEHHDHWWAFLDCAERVEGGRRMLLSTLPTGRVEPAPIAVGIEALEDAIEDAEAWMPAWRLPALREDWEECLRGLAEARANLDRVREVAATTGELEELLEAVQSVMEPLDAFADAERAWRRRWRVPRSRSGG